RQQGKNRDSSPAFRGPAFVGPPVVQVLDRFGVISAPAKSAAFVNRMQRVDNDEATRQLNSRIDGATAKPGHQLAFGAANQARLGHPSRKLVESPLVQIPNSLLVVMVTRGW